MLSMVAMVATLAMTVLRDGSMAGVSSMLAMVAMVATLAMPVLRVELGAPIAVRRRHSQSGIPNQFMLIGRVSDRKGVDVARAKLLGSPSLLRWSMVSMAAMCADSSETPAFPIRHPQSVHADRKGV